MVGTPEKPRRRLCTTPTRQNVVAEPDKPIRLAERGTALCAKCLRTELELEKRRSP